MIVYILKVPEKERYRGPVKYQVVGGYSQQPLVLSVLNDDSAEQRRVGRAKALDQRDECRVFRGGFAGGRHAAQIHQSQRPADVARIKAQRAVSGRTVREI